jgi:hypothetical protein
MAAILFVRIKSHLGAEEFERRLIERRPRFREVPGLVQKIYGLGRRSPRFARPNSRERFPLPTRR